MSTATAQPKAAAIRLLELFSGKIDRVDAKAGIIYGVKIVGVKSRNHARVLGLDPREFNGAIDQPYGYERQALRTAIPLYEGAPVRIDHPDHRITNGTRVITSPVRPALSTSGELRAVRMVDTGNDETDGLYGDIHLLLSHPHSAFVLEVAERMPDKLAISHNASGRPVLIDGRVQIDKIHRVVSCDIIGDTAGTTNGLFESSLPKDEEIEEMDTTTETPMTLEDFQAAIVEILSDGSMSPESKLVAISDLCAEQPAAGTGDAVIESLSILESAGVTATAIRVKALAALRSQKDRVSLAESWKGQGRGQRPARSAALLEQNDGFHQAESAEHLVRRLTNNMGYRGHLLSSR